MRVRLNHLLACSLEQNFSTSCTSSFKVDHCTHGRSYRVLCREEMRAILQGLFRVVEHCPLELFGTRRIDVCHSQNITLHVGSKSSSSKRTLIISSIMPQLIASSAAPGPGSCESRWQLMRAACSVVAALFPWMRTMKLVRPT